MQDNPSHPTRATAIKQISPDGAIGQFQSRLASVAISCLASTPPIELGARHGFRIVGCLRRTALQWWNFLCMHWYCIAANPKSGAEKAAESLKLKQFNILLPKAMYLSPTSRLIIRPLFGHYLFVQFDKSNPSWRDIPYTHHVKRLISADAESPIAIPDSYIESLLAKLDAEHRLDQRPKRPNSLTGATLSFEYSNRTWEGLCVESSRRNVTILFHLLGQQRELTLKRNAVRVVHAPAET